jgi:pimeloyl-ACP methyl ester carboxylesterase
MLSPRNPVVRTLMRGAVLTALLVIPGACDRTAKTQPSPVPRVEWAELDPSAVPRSPDLRTGYLVVPEDRQSQGVRTIRLPFVIMKSRSATPRPDPVLVSAGGPGGSILGRSRNRARNPLLEDRDVILLEQRGTHFAEPSLAAPRVAEALRSGWSANLNGNPDSASVERALAETLSEYRALGIGLAGYTTKESAEDIADLRRLLDIGSWNLYGSSYSTKIMLTVLRDSPAGVRAVILDSVLPLEANWDEDAPANILDAFQRLIAAAREAATLRSRLDGFEARWEGFLKAANRRPPEIALKDPVNGRPLSLRLDAAGIMNCVYAGLEDAAVIPRLPLIIDAACRGREDVLAPLAEAYLASSQGFAWGARLAVWCNEEFPFERPDRILRPPGLPAELARYVQTAVPLEALRAWPQGRPAARENLPVRSGVPTLIAAGEFDPDTPVAWSRRTASFLRDSQVVVFAGMSHVPLFSHPEAGRLVREFLNSPRRRVDPGRTDVPLPFAASLE